MSEAKEECINERLSVFNRLTSRKDCILKASHDLEDLRREFIAGGRIDADGKYEAETLKHVYTILGCLSELLAYSKSSSDLISTILNYLNFTVHIRQTANNAKTQPDDLHYLSSTVVIGICAATNAVSLKWDMKKDPIVRLDNIESIVKIFDIKNRP